MSDAKSGPSNKPAPPPSGTPAGKPAAPGPAAAAKPGAAKAPPPPASKSPVNEAADDAARKEVLRLLRGPVAQRFKALIPELANQDDPYKAAMDNHELLEKCFKTFGAQRDAFLTFLVDGKGAPVADDAVRLVCGRSVNEVTGMAVRSGMRAFAERHFGDSASAAKGKPAADAPRKRWIQAIASMFRAKHSRDGTIGKGGAARFYSAIRDALDFAWQVQFFPVYVEIPAELFEKLGIGITRMDSLEKLQRLAQLASEDVGKAEKVISNPALAKEMLENNVLAAGTVSQMSAADFNTVNDALGGLDPKKKWDVFANRITALQLASDKRISKADIQALAQHLDVLNEHALTAIVDLKLAREQISNFLNTAQEKLGEGLFTSLFGPMPVVAADDAAANEKARLFAHYVQNTLKALVTAVQQLEQKFKRDDPSAIAECLSLVIESRRDTIASEIKRLAPPPVPAA